MVLAVLDYADLIDSDLTNANLTGADLIDADLTNADLEGAILEKTSYSCESVKRLILALS